MVRVVSVWLVCQRRLDMEETLVYLVTYEGQEQSPYKISCSSYGQALEELIRAEEEYPDRRFQIIEKDVS